MRLEKIIKRDHEKKMKIDYGLQILPDTVLKIANTEELMWLLQPELKAINDGQTYVEDIDSSFAWFKGKYTGYLNAQGKRQGVGIFINKDSSKRIGEWNEDKLHGVVKYEYNNGNSSWGQYKNGTREGCMTEKSADGTVNYSKFKND
jgi:hypothetical protein